MTQSLLRCCTSIIRSSALVQASSSLSMGRAHTWRMEATRHRNAFSPFSRVVCCFVLLTRGWGKLETRPPVVLGSFPELSAFTMSLAPPVHPSPIFLTGTENLCFESKRNYLSNFWLDQIVFSKKIKLLLILRSTIVLCKSRKLLPYECVFLM